MVQPDGRVKILDFGLAKLMSPGRLTKSSMALGTAYYQAPEQSIHLSELDQRADIYSLGVMLYQMLTGTIPVGRVKAPSARTRGVSPSLDEAVLECLEPEPDERPATVAELREALQGDKARQRPSWNGPGLLPLGLILVAMLAVLGFAVWLLQPRDPAPLLEEPIPSSTAQVPEPATPTPETTTQAPQPSPEPTAPSPPALPEQKTSPAEVSASRRAALDAQAKAKQAGAEQYASTELAAADQVLKEAEARDTLKQYDTAKEGYDAATSNYGEVTTLASRIGAEVKALERAKSEATEARSQADKQQAATRAAVRYTQAQEAEEEARGMKDRNAAARKYADAAQLYTLAAEESKGQGPEPGETKTFAGIEMVWIEPGSFTMGSPASETGRDSDETQHQVTLTQGFWLGKYEVTNVEWKSLMGTEPWKGQSYVLDDPKSPVVYVSWDDCQKFIQKLNQKGEGTFRLPTEAEWEYACRAGTNTAYHFGNTEDGLAEYAWYTKNALDANGKYAHVVGKKKPNAWGLYDMHGNVWEWCQDWYGEYPSGAVTDPTGPASGQSRVLRGGSCDGNPENCRSAYRHRFTPVGRYYSRGFRLLRTP